MKVVVEQLQRRFGQTLALDAVSFAFESGQIFGFVGPNGAGKTTTMRIMATLDTPDAGDVWVDGVSTVEYPDRVRALTGFVPDALPEHPDITVHEYLDFFARAYGLRGAVRARAVEEIEQFTSLTDIRDKVLRALSKGMKQRVSLGRALLHDPPVLILDEPAAGLDPRARIELRELLLALAEQGKAILVSSHILSELSEICTGVVIIEQGRILETGTVTEVVARGVPRRTLVIRPARDHDALHAALLETPWVEAVRRAGEEIHVDFNGTDDHVCECLAGLVRREFRIMEFRHLKADLEDVFMRVTRGGVQ